MTQKLLTVLFLLCIVTESGFALGIGEWNAQTPYGNQIRHDRVNDITSYYSLAGRTELDSLTNWYFYRKHIVGSTSTVEYFVIDEIKLTIVKFENEATWRAYLSANNLSPLVWTRWYDTDWTFSKNDLIGYLILELLIGTAIAALIVFVNHIKMTATQKPTNFKRRVLITTAIFILLPIAMTMISYFMSIYPESI